MGKIPRNTSARNAKCNLQIINLSASSELIIRFQIKQIFPHSWKNKELTSAWTSYLDLALAVTGAVAAVAKLNSWMGMDGLALREKPWELSAKLKLVFYSVKVKNDLAPEWKNICTVFSNSFPTLSMPKTITWCGFYSRRVCLRWNWRCVPHISK